MAGDPTGYDSVLAEIGSGGITPTKPMTKREARIAAGLAMIREQGMSVSEAARRSEIPLTTLWRYDKGLSSLEGEEGLKINYEALHRASYDVAQIAAQTIVQSLLTEPDQWKKGDIVKAYGVATDKVAAFSQGRGGLSSGLGDIVSALLEKGDVSITRRDPSQQAVDVTPGQREVGDTAE